MNGDVAKEMRNDKEELLAYPYRDSSGEAYVDIMRI